MLIHEASKITGLTRKAIEYYAAQGLIFPTTLENGYRDYSTSDVETLGKICVLRGLGLSTRQIREILADETGQALQTAGVRVELRQQQAQKQQALLNRLAGGASYAEIREALRLLEEHRSIIERLLDAFPGYWGNFLALHFADFLTSPIDTTDQRAAYEEIIAWLDDAPPLPEEIRSFLSVAGAAISATQIGEISRNMRRQIENPGELIAQYDDAKRLAADFHASEAGKYVQALKQFCTESRYYDCFLPAMRRLSPAYAEYSDRLNALDKTLCDR